MSVTHQSKSVTVTENRDTQTCDISRAHALYSVKGVTVSQPLRDVTVVCDSDTPRFRAGVTITVQTVVAGLEKARHVTDPRFAGWSARQAQMDAVFGPDSYPDVVQLCQEKRELFRIAAQSALDRSKDGATLTAEARRWAQRWAAIKPLGRPLGTGEPA